ncbi:putative lipase atg15 [Didymella sp. IMI 355093]|nr:putative lipase atg15 [Didymella sp. IMI 355093]
MVGQYDDASLNSSAISIINGRIFTPGLAIFASPQPNTPMGGDFLHIALDISGDGALPFPPSSNPSASTRLYNITLFLTSTSLGKNLTISNGTSNMAPLTNILEQEQGSTVKHVNFEWPLCLVGDNKNAQGSARGAYNVSIHQSFRLNGSDFYTIFNLPVSQPGPRARRLDVTADRMVQAEAAGHFGPFVVKQAPITIEKPSTIHKYDGQRPMWSTMSPIWVAEDVAAPNVEDKDTIISLASMSEDAYKPGPEDPEWMDVDEAYNSSVPFGWDDSGIRGHVFSDDTNSTIILSVKGTTVAMFEGNGTSGHDKENDNLFGSCCCGQGGSYWWKQSCDCMTGTYSCDDKCVRGELRKPNRYYQATIELYEEVQRIYPDANIITTGHSLGGVLASLIGLQHGIPAVTFEAYPQAMAAKRFGLPVAGDVAPLRKNTGGFHFGHSSDPVYMGTCNGFSSFCSIGGYAFETICHTGKRCMYDVVKDWGWRQSTSTHRLRYAIENVYMKLFPLEVRRWDKDNTHNNIDCYADVSHENKD